MALNGTNLLIQMAPIPATFAGTPQDLAVLMVKRMRIVSPSGTNFIFTGDVEPTSNVGPWLKNGREWFVFDEDTKRYVPIDISSSETKWFQVGSTVPTTTTPPVWLRTTANPTEAEPQFGTPVGWYLYDGTQWVGFTELVDGSITLLKMADGVRGALITYDDSNKPVLLAPGTAGQFLISDGDDLIWSELPDTSLDGKLSPQILGPLEDTLGFNAILQSVTISLDNPREVLVYAYVDATTTGAGFAVYQLKVDGLEKDSVRFGNNADQDIGAFTLVFRGSLSGGNHNLTVDISGAVGQFTNPAGMNGHLPVKFMVWTL